MPELPEVHTTATELNKLLKNKKIVNVWTCYKSSYYKDQIKNPKYFKKFKSQIINSKIVSVTRRAKNILINLDNTKTILIHMKMTGHLLYGSYKFDKNEWKPIQKGPLNDKMNGWIRLVFTLNNKKHLALSDLRKFAKVTLENETGHLGPEPLEASFKFENFKSQITKTSVSAKASARQRKIKIILLDQTIIAGIGNIYSDEALWMSQIHPETLVSQIPNIKLQKLFKSIKLVLKKGIKFSGDSMSDYRRPDGTPGNFQKHHCVYQRKNLPCKRRGCNGKIARIVVGGRGTHYCPKCQKLENYHK
jgi:formamidopyrimidine-DNA glycosylase